MFLNLETSRQSEGKKIRKGEGGSLVSRAMASFSTSIYSFPAFQLFQMCNPFTLNSKCNRPHGHRTRPVNINLDDSLLHRLLSTDAGDFMSTIATQAPAAIEFPLPRSPFIASKPASQGRFSPTHTHTHTLAMHSPVSALEWEDPFLRNSLFPLKNSNLKYA